MKYKIGTLILLVLVGLVSLFYMSLGDGKLYVRFLDVGQGDSALITTPQGRQVLVDGGPDESVLLGLGEVLPYMKNYLDVVVLSHPDADHAAGLIPVLERYEVGVLYVPASFKETEIAQRVMELAEETGTPVVLVDKTDDVQIETGVVLDFLAPLERVSIENMEANEESLVVRLEFGERSVLFTGDITQTEENALLSAGVDLRSEVLKVPHHGSKNSSSLAFVQAVSPQVAVCSVGWNNPFGHPHEETLQTYESLGIPFYRTDKQDMITLVTDGLVWEFKN